MADMVAKGRAVAGERNRGAKLTRAEIISIRNLFATSDLTQRQIGERFGVSKTSIGFILRRKKWAHLR